MNTSPLPDDWMRQARESLATDDSVVSSSDLDKLPKREKYWYTSKPVRYTVDAIYIALVLIGLIIVTTAEIVIEIVQSFLIMLRPILYKVGINKKGDFDRIKDADFLRSKHNQDPL